MAIIYLVLLMTCALMSSTDAIERRNISTDEADFENATDSASPEIIQPDEAVINETDEADFENATDSASPEIIQPDDAVIKNETDAASTEVAETDSGHTEINKPGAVCSCPNILQSYQFDEEAVILKLKFAMTSFQEGRTVKSALRFLSQVERRVKAASDSIKALTSRLDTLQATVDGIKAKADLLPPLTSTINSLQADVVDLKAKSGEIVDLKLTVSTLVREIDTMNTTVDHLDQHIYFMTTFNASNLRLEPGPVVFDLVVTNTGDAYNAATGVFTAPRHGVYVFSAQSFSQSSTDANWDLYVNDQLVLRSRFVTTTDTSHNYVVPVTLEAGGQVYVKNFNVLNIYGTNHSFFSGWLIKAF
ncbi:uncharacterized protein LOC112575859 isoform X2 [Pomacea canaliculata]|uniref:uncharacterized protein LOC112575859 isoform X2 n=1 Tax=Pomacea canaliculata TaxID=400727 RepID=UPI000D73F125|nr:uncharacterized protein LOC112575859 isoform X2 [Pomacea canaliculata]